MSARAYQSMFIVFQALFMIWWQVSGIGGIAVLVVIGAAVVSGFRICIGRRIHAACLIVFGLFFFCLRAAGYQQTHLAVCSLIAEYLLFVQAFELLRVQRTLSSNFLPGLGIMTLASAVLALKVPVDSFALQWTYFGFACLQILVLRPDLPRLVTKSTDDSKKGLTMILTCCVVIGVGSILQDTARRKLSEIYRSLSAYRVDRIDQITTQTAARFVDSAYLSSVAAVQLSDPEAPVFTVQSSTPPGYMRTLAFNQFDGWQWRDTGSTESKLHGERNGVESLPNVPRLHDTRLSANSVFRLPAKPGGPYRQYLVNVLSGRGKLVPLPMGSAFVWGNARHLAVRSNGTISPGTLDVRAYLVYASEEFRNVASEGSLVPLTDLPSDDEQLLRDLSNEICQKASTTREKAHAIERFFADNFSYSLASNPAEDLNGRSAICAFLEERRDAHCEYFATATALLLRAQGISSRLCLGYLVYEMNDENDYYVAANRNAHAWAEAYDATSRQWIVVESTPEIDEYVARLSNDSASDAVNDGSGDYNINAQMNTWISRLVRLCGGPAVVQLLGGTVVVVLLVRYRQVLFGRSATSARERKRNQYAKQRLKADRVAAKLGMKRRPEETYHQFARRIRIETVSGGALADWYECYAAARYKMSQTYPVSPPPIPAVPIG